jgi:tetratricopeptide (TPR) repeat protein
LTEFREAALKDPNSWKPPFWIAYCHAKLSNYGYIKQYCLAAIDKSPNEVDPDVYEMLGSAYHQLNVLDSAIIAFKTAQSIMKPQRAKELSIAHKLACAEFAKKESGSKNTRTALVGDINSGYNDYSIVLTNNGKRVYFTSRRANTTGGMINPDDQAYFEDVYTGVWSDELNKFDSISNTVERINGKGFETMSWISKDGNSALITLNTTLTADKKPTKSSDICEVDFTKQGKWTAPKPIKNKTINSSYFDGAATVTADGNTMYFVSDRKGEKKATDIYVVQRTGKSWGKAVPLSDTVNTAMRETTPYISPDGRFLFFSSDGHVGMGGFDVFVTENTGSGWTKPVNLGGMINSVNDDTHFSIYKELGKAFITSSSISDKRSSLDIFEFDLNALKLPVKF